MTIRKDLTKENEKFFERVINLKVGDLLWDIVYWDGEKRDIRKFKIIKITENFIHFKFWKAPKEDIFRNKLFLSLKEALINKIKLQKEATEEYEYTYKQSLKELKFLNKKLREQK